jgi:hypothetical protein
LVVLIVVAVGACQDDDDASAPANATSPSAPAPTTVQAAKNPQKKAKKTALSLTNFTGPASPVTCTTPDTMLDFTWQTSGAERIVLKIDGGVHDQFDTNGDGRASAPLRCDGKDHEFELVAQAGGSTARQSLTIASG